MEQKRIKQLSKHLINQIAAGEVIERPASVVKELVENSVDAKATKISIEISNDCRDIRIADNGSGIHPEDILLAFSKHATSKLESSEDLFEISTMGFRGEALSSIISIAKLTCITRTKDFETGTKVECANSEVKKTQTGCAVGTIMEVKDLFYNIPARLKFLRNSKTEFSYIQELVQSIALAYPNIAFELKNNGKIVLTTTGLGHLTQTIKEIYSSDITQNVKEVLKTDELSGLKITGYVSTPDYTRSSKKFYHTYINSRTVKCPVFQKAVDMVYKNLTASGRYPIVVLNLEIPLNDVDVNVHPTKKEVRYKNPNQIFNFIYSAIDMALSNIKERPTTQIIHQESYVNLNEWQMSKMETSQASQTEREKNNDDVYVSDLPLINTQVELKPTSPCSVTKTEIQQENVYQPKLEIKTTYQEPVQEENIIGQYKKTYILIEKEDGLEIVDQHIAEERYLYEKLKERHEINSQLLFVSDVLPVSATEAQIIKENIEKFETYGYGIEFLNDNEIIFRKVPQMISRVSPKEILTDILENIEGNINNLEEKIIITTSCKSAVKANQMLTLYQMQEIIKKWRTCKMPYTCPHGRTISKTISHKDIANFFQRSK